MCDCGEEATFQDTICQCCGDEQVGALCDKCRNNQTCSTCYKVLGSACYTFSYCEGCCIVTKSWCKDCSRKCRDDAVWCPKCKNHQELQSFNETLQANLLREVSDIRKLLTKLNPRPAFNRKTMTAKIHNKLDKLEEGIEDIVL